MAKEENTENKTGKNIVELVAETKETVDKDIPKGETFLTCFCRCGTELKNVVANNGIAICPNCEAENKC